MTTVENLSSIRCTNSAEMKLPAGHYSHVCVAGGLAFISGQLPIDASGKFLADGSFAEQTDQVLANIDACLRAVGVDRQSLTQVRVYVTDIAQWPEFNQRYAEWIGDHKPARAVAGVSQLHYGAALEVEAIALVSE